MKGAKSNAPRSGPACRFHVGLRKILPATDIDTLGLTTTCIHTSRCHRRDESPTTCNSTDAIDAAVPDSRPSAQRNVVLPCGRLTKRGAPGRMVKATSTPRDDGPSTKSAAQERWRLVKQHSFYDIVNDPGKRPTSAAPSIQGPLPILSAFDIRGGTRSSLMSTKNASPRRPQRVAERTKTKGHEWYRLDCFREIDESRAPSVSACSDT